MRKNLLCVLACLLCGCASTDFAIYVSPVYFHVDLDPPSQDCRGYVWVPGYWEERGGVRYWIPGYWREELDGEYEDG